MSDPVSSLSKYFNGQHYFSLGAPLSGRDISSRKHACVILTPLSPFYIVELGFTGVYIVVLVSAREGGLWVLVGAASARRF